MGQRTSDSASVAEDLSFCCGRPAEQFRHRQGFAFSGFETDEKEPLKIGVSPNDFFYLIES